MADERAISVERERNQWLNDVSNAVSELNKMANNPPFGYRRYGKQVHDKVNELYTLLHQLRGDRETVL